ncbi:hypothetical protein FD21_GL000003 [Liquorilactobacillus vini DSM 20605]|uniref:Uncharacterized protein n=1 Tax=Liquorilactobacillus vini DSM 20605 TaxID=1133569 RepID=A0A0R2CD47_9LACO|nr:hypothetical protein [Liquorilactobacillus vini]KRM89710.1 hypothetical protein FD21_GL000003 [Liquorilactobacillus vini DSM 20605]
MTVALTILQIGLFIITAIALIAYIHLELNWSQFLEVTGGLIIFEVTGWLIWQLLV